MTVSPAVREALVNHVKLVEGQSASGHALPASEASFYVADLGEVVRKWNLWKGALPDVTPFFAVKSSYDRWLIQTLASCGAGFDCASAEEIELILSLGISAQRIIFTHPCKPIASLGLCRRLGVTLITFDNECELRKLHQHYPESHLVLRIFADDPTGIDPLGTKFGACRDDFRGLIGLAKELHMHLAGASFHAAPSVASNPIAYVRGVRHAAEVFAHARALGLNPGILDIGGGYTDATFAAIATAVRGVVAECFAACKGRKGGLRVIAEPGTLFSSSPFFLTAKVVARRGNATAFGREPATRLYINDGIYSNFMMRFIVNATFSPIAVIQKGAWREQKAGGDGAFKCSVWGRTCDSNDCINRECGFDQEVDIGDWLVFKDMGGKPGYSPELLITYMHTYERVMVINDVAAYTTVCNTSFNGFTSSSHTIYLEPSEPGEKVKADFEPLRSKL
ncbi:hypothetical protein F4802DRAFT_607986 [Xylaria palmicola]|nr:hypothetical protein F4802DRAFT_607986 [Xylaria palmicola]